MQIAFFAFGCRAKPNSLTALTTCGLIAPANLLDILLCANTCVCTYMLTTILLCMCKLESPTVRFDWFIGMDYQLTCNSTFSTVHAFIHTSTHSRSYANIHRCSPTHTNIVIETSIGVHIHTVTLFYTRA